VEWVLYHEACVEWVLCKRYWARQAALAWVPDWLAGRWVAGWLARPSFCTWTSAPLQVNGRQCTWCSWIKWTRHC